MQDHDKSPVDAPAEDATPTVGARLRNAREAQELSLEQAAGELRIEAQWLLALEEDRFEALGAPVFAKGYLKQYGLRLGLDHGELLAQYYRQVRDTEVPVVPSRPIRLRDDRQVNVAGATVVTLLVLAALGILWWLNAPSTSAPGQVSSPPVSEPAMPAESPPIDLPSQPRPAPGERVPEPELERGQVLADAVPQQEPDAPVMPEPIASGVVSTAGAGAQLSAADPQLLAVDPVNRPGGLTVEIRFAEDCWAEVSDGEGMQLFYRLGRAGESATVEAVPPVSFLFGNAAAVQLLIDGEPYPVPGSSRSGSVARFSVAAAGR